MWECSQGSSGGDSDYWGVCCMIHNQDVGLAMFDRPSTNSGKDVLAWGSIQTLLVNMLYIVYLITKSTYAATLLAADCADVYLEWPGGP
jgi:hypothetical protein